MDYERPYCFIRGGYQIATERVIMQFNDYSIYAFNELTLDDWNNWVDAYPHGTFFNLEYRNTDIEFLKLKTYPDNLVSEIIEPSSPWVMIKMQRDKCSNPDN